MSARVLHVFMKNDLVVRLRYERQGALSVVPFCGVNVPWRAVRFGFIFTWPAVAVAVHAREGSRRDKIYEHVKKGALEISLAGGCGLYR